LIAPLVSGYLRLGVGVTVRYSAVGVGVTVRYSAVGVKGFGVHRR